MGQLSYIEKEIDKIINDESFEFPKNLAMSAAWILGNFKGLNLKVYDVRGKSALADFFVIASATNSTQSSAMADTITTQLKRHGHNPISREGVGAEAEWTLLDFGDIIVHILLDNSREFYNFDEMWTDGSLVNIPNEYYYSDDGKSPIVIEEKDDDEDFF